MGCYLDLGRLLCFHVNYSLCITWTAYLLPNSSHLDFSQFYYVFLSRTSGPTNNLHITSQHGRESSMPLAICSNTTLNFFFQNSSYLRLLICYHQLCWVINTTMALLLLSCFSRVQLCVTPQTSAHQAPLSLGFSRQEHWSGLPFSSPMHESEK